MNGARSTTEVQERIAGRLLAVDVGNTRVKLAVFEWIAPETGAWPEPLKTWACRAGEAVPWEAIAPWGGHEQPLRGAVAGVNPPEIERLLASWDVSRWPTPMVVDEQTALPLQVLVEAPERVGRDRLLSAIAVNCVRSRGRPAIVVNAGTATTVDLITGNGAFAGGAIFPGVNGQGRALHEQTALLPRVTAEELTGHAVPVVGVNTRGAISSGLLYGQIGAIRELTTRMDAETNGVAERFLTGGAAPLLAVDLGPTYRAVTDLPLRGLAVVATTVSTAGGARPVR